MILYKSGGICLIECQRYEYGCYLYEVDGKRECVTADECKKAGWNAYLELLVCVPTRPASNENFVKRIDNVYSCNYI